MNGIKTGRTLDNSDFKDDSVQIALENEEKHTEEKIESRKIEQFDTYAEIASRGFFGLIGYLLDLQLWFSLS